ncbi:MAG: ribonucleoside-diphosphate reductase subunit alpha [Erysipelotrichia bacterium]|nr:ribonucleoside-diphosphate reductase subunit alpha [Erysipelotrichia bacterium]NCC54555.1 ribonucleoside-diphosphate reductase subunit alpha [Erysipelotrichia bacterium]
MKIKKRNQTLETFTKEKIINAILAAFQDNHSQIEKAHLIQISEDIEMSIKQAKTIVSVEEIQDMVEEKLMQHNYYQEAKRYILYREKRSKQREIITQLNHLLKREDLLALFRKIQKEFDEEVYSLQLLLLKFQSFYKENLKEEEKLTLLIKACVELISIEAPKWEMIAARFLNVKIENEIKDNLKLYPIHNFYDKIKHLTNEGYYGTYILEQYREEEVLMLASYMDQSRNDLFTYSGLDLLAQRYLIRSHGHKLLESPQELFMGIAMHLAIPEKENKVYWAKQIYDILSTLKVTMATPTLANARKPFHQLSSCFIDCVEDSLSGIYKSLDNFAQVSKYGGGMGLYFGKVRASGSDIRGFEGAAGGVIRWIRLVNDTAVAVDQLGVRQGAVAVYLDAWHKDLPAFLNLRTNNGDDRQKAHDVFPAVCYPDLFWRKAEEDLNQKWYLMCPHEIKKIKGYALEDYYGIEWEKRYEECVHDIRIAKTEILLKDVVRLILRSAVETGTPFAFFRDQVNEMNPNKHKGIIYCSNLCSEIAQNMSAISQVKQEIKVVDGEEIVVDYHQAGDFVVCNLASLILGNINVHDEVELEHIINVVVRALDNVIDLNYYPTPYAKITNHHYRSIGLGTSGYHHMLAKLKIAFESEEHLSFVDQLYEKINYYTIKASHEIAKEKGSYDYFKDSDWDNGNYFSLRHYTSQKWQDLQASIHQHGMRNAYLLAIAPTSSTSIIAGSSAAVDPIMNKFFLEEKKGSMITRIAPDLNTDTFWYYKNAHHIDQQWIVKAASIRQRHIDQSQSLNLYITNDFSLRQLMNLYIEANKGNVKTIYYVRSKSLEVEECESCAS